MDIKTLEKKRAALKPPPRVILKPPPTNPAEADCGALEQLDLSYVEKMDTKVRSIVSILRERGSVLILDPDKMETQEEEASAELYAVMSEVATARLNEDLREREYSRVQDIVYSELMRTHERDAALQSEKTTLASGRSTKAAKHNVTDLRKLASIDFRVEAAYNEWVRAREARRQAEAYCKAVEQKLTLLPGLQGARNKNFG